MNSKIKQQRELIAKKEGKFYVQNTNSTTEMPLEIGQKIWHQDPYMKKLIPGTVGGGKLHSPGHGLNSRCVVTWQAQEFCREPNSILLESENGAVYRRNRNFIKPMQTFEKNSNSTQQNNLDPDMSYFPAAVNSKYKNGDIHIHSATLQPVPTSITNTNEKNNSTLKNYNSAVQKTITPVPVRVSPRINKGVAPKRFSYGK